MHFVLQILIDERICRLRIRLEMDTRRLRLSALIVSKSMEPQEKRLAQKRCIRRSELRHPIEHQKECLVCGELVIVHLVFPEPAAAPPEVPVAELVDDECLDQTRSSRELVRIEGFSYIPDR